MPLWNIIWGSMSTIGILLEQSAAIKSASETAPNYYCDCASILTQFQNSFGKKSSGNRERISCAFINNEKIFIRFDNFDMT